jgi:hypothetical protein
MSMHDRLRRGSGHQDLVVKVCALDPDGTDRVTLQGLVDLIGPVSEFLDVVYSRSTRERGHLSCVLLPQVVPTVPFVIDHACIQKSQAQLITMGCPSDIDFHEYLKKKLSGTGAEHFKSSFADVRTEYVLNRTWVESGREYVTKILLLMTRNFLYRRVAGRRWSSLGAAKQEGLDRTCKASVA